MNREEAWNLLRQYNKESFHLRHALTVEGIMRYFAKELGYADQEEYWGIVGLLHDLDFELYPEEHCVKSQELMREHGVDEMHYPFHCQPWLGPDCCQHQTGASDGKSAFRYR